MLAVAVAVTVALALAATSAPIAPDPSAPIDLGSRMELLVAVRDAFVDTRGAIDPEAAATASGYVRVDRDVPSWGLGAAVIWARFSTVPENAADAAAHRWFLRAGFPRPDRIAVYSRDAASGRFVPRAHGGLVDVTGTFAQDIVVPIDVNAHDHLVRIETQPARVNLQLVEQRTLGEVRALEMLIAGVYYGIFLGLFLYNLFLGLSLKDGTHALYCAFLVCMALHVAARDGLGFVEAPLAISRGGAGLNMTSLIMLVFARRFLRLTEPLRAKKFRLMNTVIGVELAICAALVVIAFILGAPIAAVSAGLTAFTIGTVVVAAVLVARDGDEPARWFLLAWSVLIASCVWSLVHAFGWSDANFLTAHGMKVGSALEMVLLSLALAARVRALRAEKERAELALASARADAQAELAGRVIEAQEDERARYARELHDGLGHALLGIKERAAQAVRQGAGLDVDEARKVSADAQKCIDDARAMARNLVPPSLSRLGLVEALRGIAADTAAAAAMKVTFDDTRAGGLDDAFGDRAIHLVRIVQEALANAVRHGCAKNATVALRAEPHFVVISVDDDGRGFDEAHARMGLGRLDMEQRGKLLGGTVVVSSSIGRGTHVEVRIPHALRPALVPTSSPASASSSSTPAPEHIVKEAS